MVPPPSERVLSFADALATVLTHARALPPADGFEIVPLGAAAGRVLAAPIHAERDQPPFARSTRDGYAVRASDLGGPLRVVGSLRAGEIPAGPSLAPGEALEIMTGAPVPAGADAVLMYEHAMASQDPAGGDFVQAVEGRTLVVGENVVPRAAEARAGAELVAGGRRLAAPEIALAASCGLQNLRVYEPPRVAIVATGDELVELDAAPEAWQIRNSNSYALAALVREAGGSPQRLAIAADTREDIDRRITQAGSADLLLLSGGVSMGKYDLVEQVLRDFGAEFFFTGTLIQPGKPLVFGRLPRSREQGSGNRDQSSGQRTSDNGRLITRGQEAPAEKPAEAHKVQRSLSPDWQYFFGLPGNPVSTEVCFRLFVAPLLRALAGQTELGPRFVEARLAAGVCGGARVTRFLPALLTADWQSATVELVPWQGSGDLAANARANCFAVLPIGPETFLAGETIRVLLR